jgi:predicted acyltransferase
MTPAEATPARRLVSLDAFRGAVIAFMVLVNNGGGPESYTQLEHSKWHGWTLTDLVFPSFLWMVGVSITLSLGKRLRSGADKSALFRQIVRRAAILIVLGLFVYLYPDFNFAGMRFPGVLQRIGICYLIASFIYLTTGVRGQMAWIAGLMLVYAIVMNYFPVPGFGAGRFDLEGNFAHFVDRHLFGKHNYHGGDWDPEGAVSTLPAIATTLFGIMAGHLLQWRRSLSQKLLWMCLLGAVLTAAGLIWNIWMPINKKLWTDSFTLFNAGIDFMLFAGFAWIVDAREIQRPVKPLVILGMNAIAVYMAAELLASTLDWFDVKDWLYNNLFARVASPLNASLLFAIAFVLTMYLFAYVLYRRNWFWRI